MDKNITINILPQSGEAWLCIAVAVVLGGLTWGLSNTGGDNYRVECERSRRIKMLAEKGYTNAVLAEIQRDLTTREE
jgi:hypothetical protein